MKLNCDTIVKTMTGKPFQETVLPPGKKPEEIQEKDIKKVNVTVGSACVGALLFNYPDEQKIQGKEKFERWNLAKKFNAGGVIEITVEELVKVKELIGKMYATNMVGPLFELLENLEEKSNGKETKTKAKKAKGLLTLAKEKNHGVASRNL